MTPRSKASLRVLLTGRIEIDCMRACSAMCR